MWFWSSNVGLALFIILRSIFKNKFTKHIKFGKVLIITATFSMLILMRAYLLPFASEIYLIKNNFNFAFFIWYY